MKRSYTDCGLVGIWRGASVVCKGAVLMCRLYVNFYGG